MILLPLKRIFVSLLLAALPFSIPASAQTGPDSGDPSVSYQAHPLTKTDVDSWLDGLMPYALEEGGFAGAVVAVVKDGELLTSRGYGYADLETRREMDAATTLVRPGSISKLFTWTAVMQLKEQGKVDLDTDVNEYLDFTIPEAFDQPVTLRHLMTHSAGFEDVLKNLMMQDPEQMPALGDYVKSQIPARIFPPGEVPAYSNYGTALAGYIVERVSGVGFDTYVEENIFAPLDMKASSFRQPLPASLADAMSAGYINRDDLTGQPYELISAAPAGALASTAEDMAKFMIAHLNRGAGVLLPGTAEEMYTAQTTNLPSVNGMALGFYQQNRLGVSGIGHGGDTMYFHSDLSLFPEHNVGIFLSVNSQGRTPVQSLILREQFASKFVERYLASPAPAATVDAGSADRARQMAGVYEVSRASATNFMALGRYLGQVKITAGPNGSLHTPFIGLPATWHEIEPYVWQRNGGSQRLAADIRDGRVHQWAYEPASPFMVYSPPPWFRSSAILSPLLLVALLVSIATVLAWPVSAVLRWHYKRPFPHSGQAALSFRAVRATLVLVLLYLAGWMVVFSALGANIANLNGAFDGPIRFLQIAQILLYVALGTALWNLAVTWSARRSWLAMVWSLLLPLSVAILIWFAAVTGLLGFSLDY